MPKLIRQDNHHPWFEDDTSFVTQVWETESHEASEQSAGMMNAEGWSIYLVANCGTPSFVVYRKVSGDDDCIKVCTVCGREGLVGRCCGRDTWRYKEDDLCSMCQGSGTLTDDVGECECPHCDGEGVE